MTILAASITTLVIVAATQLPACRETTKELHDSNVGATEVKRRALPALPSRPLSARLADAGERARRAAAATRGLPWKNDVGMVELTGWEYGTRARELAEVLGMKDLDGFSKLAGAGAILPEGTDLASLAVAFTAASAGATYSPLDKRILLLTPESEAKSRPDLSLLTHEFVHALQDQHFDLLKTLLERPYNFDRTEAVFALVEGDAMNVERRLQVDAKTWDSRALDEIARNEDERFAPYRARIGSLFPPLLTETFIFRYRDGARFVESIRRTLPAITVDEVFRRPPVSSEQVLHPEKYLSNEHPIEVTINHESLRDDGWTEVVSTPLGEIGIRGLLMAGIPNADAIKASSGWGGDRAFVFDRKGSTPLFIWKSMWDTEADAREFYDAYNLLMKKTGRAAGARDSTETAWRDGAAHTFVVIDGTSVSILRGAGTDVRSFRQE